MFMETVQIRDLSVSKVILGGNPFSGFSHQGPQRDLEMRRYYTVARIKQTLRHAERMGVNTHISRADPHVTRYLLEYWDEGGQIQWIAQTCPELGSIERGIETAIAGKAKACCIHGGAMDSLLASHQLDRIPGAMDMIHQAGMAAGFAGHDPRVLDWAEQAGLDADFYMCSYYNLAHRDTRGERVSGMPEWFNHQDRLVMTQLIRRLSKPAIHYKVLAGGRNSPREAIECAARSMRPQDAMCLGVFTKHKPDMLAEDIRLLEDSLVNAG